MRYLAVVSLLVLAACGSHPVALRSADGRTATCGPYSTFWTGDNIAAVEHEARCITDYQRQGFDRVAR